MAYAGRDRDESLRYSPEAASTILAYVLATLAQAKGYRMVRNALLHLASKLQTSDKRIIFIISPQITLSNKIYTVSVVSGSSPTSGMTGSVETSGVGSSM